jgi:hypothetical protein
MNFTDVMEINQLVSQVIGSYHNTPKAKDNNHDSLCGFTPRTAGKEHNPKSIDYGKALEDTPPDSNSEQLTDSSGIKKILDSSKDDPGDIESIEEFMKDIKSQANTLSEISPTESRKRSPKRRTTLHISMTQTPNSGSFEKDSTLDTPDNKKSNFQKLNEVVISQSYTEQKKLRSCLSANLSSIKEV